MDPVAVPARPAGDARRLSGFGLLLLATLLVPTAAGLVPAADPLQLRAEPGDAPAGPASGGQPNLQAEPDHVALAFESGDPDVAPDAVAPEGPSVPEAVVAATAAGAGLAAIAAALFWKPLFAFFTRLQSDELLAAPERRRVYDAIAARPGITVPQLAAVCTTSRNNIRYHTAVLRRHARIRAFRALRAWRFVTVETDPEPVRRRILVESNPRLRAFLELVDPAGAPARDLVERLRAAWGLPRSSGWHLVQQATQGQLVVRERRDGRLFLKPSNAPVPLPPPPPGPPGPPPAPSPL